jgi:hypothetical protein
LLKNPHLKTKCCKPYRYYNYKYFGLSPPPPSRNKIKNKEYHTVGTVPISNKKNVERDKIDTPRTQINSLS